MKPLLLGLMLLVTAGAAIAEWTIAGFSDEADKYVDIATIRRNGNLVKMWDLADFKTKMVRTDTGDTYLSSKMQSEYDCKEEKVRILAFNWFSGQMGSGKVVYLDHDPSDKWSPISPGSVNEILWKIACGKK